LAGEGREFCQGSSKWGEREKAGKIQGSKTSPSSASACAGEEGEQCRSKRHYFRFCLFGITQKWVLKIYILYKINLFLNIKIFF